jgi:hypothetical protein
MLLLLDSRGQGMALVAAKAFIDFDGSQVLLCYFIANHFFNLTYHCSTGYPDINSGYSSSSRAIGRNRIRYFWNLSSRAQGITSIVFHPFRSFFVSLISVKVPGKSLLFTRHKLSQITGGQLFGNPNMGSFNRIFQANALFSAVSWLCRDANSADTKIFLVHLHITSYRAIYRVSICSAPSK